MHLEVLVEDLSGKLTLEALLPAILSFEHTFSVHSYRGIGRLPRNLTPTGDPRKRILLDQLPRILQGYGQAFAAYPPSYHAAVVIVCDLDKRCLKTFRDELLGVLELCSPKPKAKFCIAVEETEAWLLGDTAAVVEAYPKAKRTVLTTYSNDSICGTWECLADAIHPGGAIRLKDKAYNVIGSAKCEWASNIARRMNIDSNISPSFIYFRESLREIVL